MYTNFTLTAFDGLKLSCAVFGHEAPDGIVQIIHGLNEYKDRYYDFCRFLQKNGYAVVISDNRGHGHSVNNNYPLGHMDSIEQMVQDQRLISEYIKSRYPNIQLHLFGHSFGSCIARKYLQRHDSEIVSLIMSGTVYHIKGVDFGIIFGKFLTSFSGKMGHDPILMKLGEQKDDTWVVSDKKVLQHFRDDPLCNGYKYTNSGKLTLWESVSQLKKYRLYSCSNPKLPILSLSGEFDPITGGEKGINDTVNTLQRIGYHNVRSIVYPYMKHEILNEPEKCMVYEDVLNFIQCVKLDYEAKV